MAFWREVARLFCANSATINQIDDLSDYLAARQQRERGYSVKGRTMASLRRQMREWHRDLEMVARIEAARRRAFRERGGEDTGRWAGSPLADWSWMPSAREARVRNEQFVVTQLITADELVAEGRAMHHCVSSYADYCMAGQTSIWSMRRGVTGSVKRLLTIEVNRANHAVQVRGFANRPATLDERQVVERWVQQRGVSLPKYW
jgi:hypothetical protein